MVAIQSPPNRNYIPDASNPATDYWTLTPSDSVNETQSFRAIYVGTTGNIALVSERGNVVTFPNVAVGIFPVGGVRINVTNTTASNLIGFV